jgi:hypothetical protein
MVIKKNLEEANVVHFFFDLWTSPNHRAILGVIAHWVDSTGCLQRVLLGLRRFRGTHTGANQAAQFWSGVEDFDIT